MRSGLALFTLLGIAAASCGTSNRHFSNASGGTSGQGGSSGGTAGSSAGRASFAGSGATLSDAGAAGTLPDGDNAGAAGTTDEPPDLCIGTKCDSPPAGDCVSGTEFQSYDTTGTCTGGVCSYVSHSISCTCKSHACTSDPCAGLSCDGPPSASCKDTNTLVTYAGMGTCSGGSCTYKPTETPCPYGCANAACKADPCATMTCRTPPAPSCQDANTRLVYAMSGTCSSSRCSYGSMPAPCTGDTPKCKDPGTGAQCVACLANADCSNGGTCSANACVCTNRFNGKHCEFQVLRDFTRLPGDGYSAAANVSHDGTIIVGTSSTSDNATQHAVRSVNSGALQFIPQPMSVPGTNGCSPLAVDSAGNVLISCYGSAGNLFFLYSAGGATTPVDWPTGGGAAYDISTDGKVIVGGLANGQAARKIGTAVNQYGPLFPNGNSRFRATNNDGSICVGENFGNGYQALRWTASTGLAALPTLSNWVNTSAQDISTDGNVIVGWASAESEVLSGQIAVKWTGASQTATALSATLVAAAALAVNSDGSVIVGSQGYPSAAMVWDSAGAHTVASLIASTPDLTSSWTLDRATGVSDDGKFIVGTGTYQGSAEGWVVHLP